MTKKLKSTYLILAAAVLFFSVCMFALREAHAGTQADVTLSAQGDEISSFDVSFTAEDSFVYTARARFSDGQAAGVAFGIDGDGAFVLNVDRKDNRTKLIYFSETEEGLSAQVLAEDYYIGNANSTDEELARVQSRVAEKGEFYLKVAITGGAEPSVKCYVDDILRFCFDGALSLNSLAGGVVYDGGAIGLNVYNATAEFGEIYYGEGDFTHYTELYRNQYHYSQFSGWNNDPNGLVFDGEYYHLYFQTQPFQKTWGDMYWGHARSRDLLHWETCRSPCCRPTAVSCGRVRPLSIRITSADCSTVLKAPNTTAPLIFSSTTRRTEDPIRINGWRTAWMAAFPSSNTNAL